MNSQLVSTLVAETSINQKENLSNSTNSSPNPPSQTVPGEKHESDESQATIPTSFNEQPPSKVSKNRRINCLKKWGTKGLNSVFFCFNSVDKPVREKDITHNSKGTISSIATSTSKSLTSQADTKASAANLVYSATPGQSQAPVAALPNSFEKDERRLSSISKKHLLVPISEEHKGRKCLVLDLDETLVHSSFKPIDNPDFIVPVEIDNQVHNVYVSKRPGVDEFLKDVGEHYEVVVFTASLSKYADPVLDILDIHKVVKHRLFRESCYNHNGNYVKDLSQLGRELNQTIIIDNSPTSYLFHPSNAVPITTWFSDLHDNELLDLIPFLRDLSIVDDVTKVLDTTYGEHD